MTESAPALLPLVVEGLVLGWNVAWVPGPINAEMIRRGLERGIGPAVALGAGASSGDFLWALAVAGGLGALADGPGVRAVLGVVSTLLLLALGTVFLRTAVRARAAPTAAPDAPAAPGLDASRGGFLLGLTLALTSPWNLAFWLAVLGREDLAAGDATRGLVFAAAVVAGAMTWCGVLAVAVRTGSRFRSPAWRVVVPGLTGLLLLGFGLRQAWRLWGPG